MVEKRFADREIGDKYASSKARLVTPTELDMFCNITGMRGEAFLSDEAARAMGMKSRLLPGAMSLAILFSLIDEFVGGAVFTKMNNLSLVAPVYPYDKLSAELEVVGKKETSKGDRVFMTYNWVLKNQDEVTVAQAENT